MKKQNIIIAIVVVAIITIAVFIYKSKTSILNRIMDLIKFAHPKTKDYLGSVKWSKVTESKVAPYSIVYSVISKDAKGNVVYDATCTINYSTDSKTAGTASVSCNKPAFLWTGTVDEKGSIYETSYTGV